MAVYSAGAAEHLASQNPRGTALSDHSEQAQVLKVILGSFQGSPRCSKVMQFLW